MAEIITMPDLGFDATSGVLANWLKKVGDTVEVGEPIAEIESDKVTLEVESPAGGVLLELLMQPGQTVAVGASLARLGSGGELTTAGPAAASPPDSPATVEPEESEPFALSLALNEEEATEKESLADGRAMLELPTSSVAVHPLGTTPDGVMATPIARRMAQEHNLDLTQINGSGPGGRILRGDVEGVLAQSGVDSEPTTGQAPARQPEPLASPLQPLAAASFAAGEHERPGGAEAASPLRRAIAQRMSQSKQTIPHFYITVSVGMDAALALRSQINQTLPGDEKVTVNDLVVKAVALALREFPALNSSYVEGRVVGHDEINVGTAVAVEGGLLTVVTRQADQQTISHIAQANKSMIQRARSGKVKPADVTGGTFTVSNLGGYDTDHFAAIISPPQAAILGVATARKMAVVVDGQVVVRTIMQITLSADHRVTDGAEAAQFLQAVGGLLEAPLKLLV